MINLKSYVRNVLFEMSRADKVDYRENYGHIGAVRDALYIHWVRNCYQFEKNFPSDFNSVENYGDKKKIILRKFINVINGTLRAINSSTEVSCNLVSADRSVPVSSNSSAFGELWGDIGFLIKPKAVTDSYDVNIGTQYDDVSQGSSGSRFRKRVKPWRDHDHRSDYVTSARERARKSFPLEDEEAYKKAAKKMDFDGFAYNQSEFFVVADEIVGIILLDVNEWFDGLFEFEFDFDKDEKIDIYEAKRKVEKEYLLSICKQLGIPLYESDGKEIFDVPRLQSDL